MLTVQNDQIEWRIAMTCRPAFLRLFSHSEFNIDKIRKYGRIQ